MDAGVPGSGSPSNASDLQGPLVTAVVLASDSYRFVGELHYSTAYLSGGPGRGVVMLRRASGQGDVHCILRCWCCAVYWCCVMLLLLLLLVFVIHEQHCLVPFLFLPKINCTPPPPPQPMYFYSNAGSGIFHRLFLCCFSYCVDTVNVM